MSLFSHMQKAGFLTTRLIPCDYSTISSPLNFLLSLQGSYVFGQTGFGNSADPNQTAPRLLEELSDQDVLCTFWTNFSGKMSL